MAMEEYCALPKTLALQELHHQIVSCHIQDIHWESYSSAEMHSVYFAAPADWATHDIVNMKNSWVLYQ